MSTIALVSVHGDPLALPGAEEAGGQNVYVRELARALVRRGHAVDVYTRGRESGFQSIHDLDGARVIRLPCGPAGFVPRTELYPHLPAFVREMALFARRADVRYDLLHTNYWLSGWVGMQLAEHWRVPQVHTHHSLGAVKFAVTGQAPALGRQRLDVEEQLGAWCDTIIATSPEDLASMARYYARRPNAVIVPCGLDPVHFHPGDQVADRLALGLPADRPVLAYAGRFDPAKGVETFVDAAARVAAERPVTLLLAGGFDPAASDGREFRRIVALVEARGLTHCTRFLGRLEPAALATTYRAADVVVVPSHYESFGLVAIEAMACGTPVVASDVGGLRFAVVHRETGLLSPARDERAFASAITTLLDDPALRARMGDDAQRLAHRLYTWDAVAARMEGVYGSLAGARLPVAM